MGFEARGIISQHQEVQEYDENLPVSLGAGLCKEQRGEVSPAGHVK